eukprot:TRINITY_DN34876_c0_g1_i1.p1 TRINITY_DN34876_c0_g1~~TRINITY_DN34876_c0_g1_i1.p1  ORF type:complete len:110 (-),score=11.81 TRINITY_DN34876_c0_g1_i1:144-473(-)
MVGRGVYLGTKAFAPITWSETLYITLVRGLPGTRRDHRRTLEALGLRRCNYTVIKWNTPTVRGQINQVKRLVAVETKEMYWARKNRLAELKALRPPIVVNHEPSSPASS